MELAVVSKFLRAAKESGFLGRSRVGLCPFDKSQEIICHRQPEDLLLSAAVMLQRGPEGYLGRLLSARNRLFANLVLHERSHDETKTTSHGTLIAANPHRLFHHTFWRRLLVSCARKGYITSALSSPGYVAQFRR